MMRLLYIIIAAALLNVLSCGPQKPSPDKKQVQAACLPADSLSDDHYFHSQPTGQVIRILPDSAQNGAFRKLEILEAEDCSLQREHWLPSDADDPTSYRLADLEYNSAYHFLGIAGDGQLFCYRLDSLKLIGPFKPEFSHPTVMEDAQSGQIQRLELWEEFLLGYMEDYGPFAYDLRPFPEPSPILPFREWRTEDGQYHSLFLFPGREEGFYQPLVPIYDQQANTINLEVFFPEPVFIDPDEQPEPTDDSPIVKLIHSEGEVLEINMASGMAIQ